MEKLKKIDNNREIFIKLCLTLAKHGFKFLGTRDLGEVSGFCYECGHLIRYEQNFQDIQTGDEFTIGSSCMFKIYILSHWRDQIKEKDLENKHLQRAGKWLWIISRDGYLDLIDGDIPQPKDYDGDFKKLADDLKNLVLKVRSKIKKEKEEKIRVEKSKMIQNKLKKNEDSYHIQSAGMWLDSLDIDLDKCNEWEINFLETMYTVYNKGWTLSEKQKNTFKRIKREKKNCRDVNIDQDLIPTKIVNDIPKKNDYSQLNDWEKDFMESIDKLVDSGVVLSKKQLDILDKIDVKLSNIKNLENENIFVGKKINSWLINDLSGVWVEGIVKVVKNETELAILCDVIVIDNSKEIFLEEKWIPKSQIVDEDFSL